MIPYDDDKNSKHSLEKTGIKYVFSIKEPQPEDAGFYQVDVEEANVLTTDFQGKYCTNETIASWHLLWQIRTFMNIYVHIHFPCSFSACCGVHS